MRSSTIKRLYFSLTILLCCLLSLAEAKMQIMEYEFPFSLTPSGWQIKTMVSAQYHNGVSTFTLEKMEHFTVPAEVYIMGNSQVISDDNLNDFMKSLEPEDKKLGSYAYPYFEPKDVFRITGRTSGQISGRSAEIIFGEVLKPSGKVFNTVSYVFTAVNKKTSECKGMILSFSCRNSNFEKHQAEFEQIAESTSLDRRSI